MKYKTLKGLQDILPPEVSIWQHIEAKARNIFRAYGYQEIRLPILESTNIFVRSIGETSDIVEKEMYTFQDKGGRSVTLRPEGTASFVRAYVEHHLYNNPAPQKYYYMGPMFRYERPQAYRYRQFYQIGAEAMGVEDPKLDAEIISMLTKILSGIGLAGLNFEITSIGCKKCRPAYRDALKNFLREKLNSFCSDCQRRFDVNPLRILDCKVPDCVSIRQGSPPVIDYLCAECKEHFESLKHHVILLKVPHTINPNLVRGLDYYTRTVFEVQPLIEGSQSTIGGGGRYDHLIEEIGGKPTPAIGFSTGIERIILNLKRQKVDIPSLPKPLVYVAEMGAEAKNIAVKLSQTLRDKGIGVVETISSRSLRAQLRQANSVGARFAVIIGEDEVKNSTVTLRDMTSAAQETVALSDIVEVLKRHLNK